MTIGHGNTDLPQPPSDQTEASICRAWGQVIQGIYLPTRSLLTTAVIYEAIQGPSGVQSIEAAEQTSA